MIKYRFVGGEYIDPMIAESLITFVYTLYADDDEMAKDMLMTIFPGVMIMSYSKSA